ncbi:CU044_5270 family protein [Micromonospora halotolerans]|uniref:CU044_5270 family protein n=1 Tax=Micromonospora halotolerans TaxID=709879 RepID=A0ABZ0A2B0_9ACTN|nr:CU044_5270 family protein [Micromonospora halotolerans]WNM41555.1 CU044_5270 family protein [Micromonospora halotolerans]
MIDDITALRESWSEAEPPSPEARDRARAALRARIAEHGAAVPSRPERHGRRLPGWAWRSGLAALGAAALVAGVVAAGGPDPATPPARPAPYVASGPVAQTFELAAVHAETEPFTPPRPDQWTYVELRIVRGKIAQDKGQDTRETTRSWQRADGRQSAVMLDGKLEVSTESTDLPQVTPPQDYPTLAGLPTDPRALLEWLRDRSPSGRDGDEVAYNLIDSMLRDNVLPPGVKATLLRALALIPGVTRSSGPVDFDGRPAIALGMVQDGWRQEDILLDPTTHEFLGGRTVVVEDHTTPEGVRLKEGDVEVELIRVAGRIVDAPGQTG